MLYKLTNSSGQTYNCCQWGENVTRETDGRGNLCGPGWLHAYTDANLAVLLNPSHANFANPLLWEAEGMVEKEDHGLKVGTRRLTTIRQIPLPVFSTKQKVAFGILCAMSVYKKVSFMTWAKNWLSDQDRSVDAANAVANAAASAAADAAYGAANTAYDAANAAYAAANAAYAVANANTSAAYAAAYAAANAGASAAYAAAYAARANATIPLIQLAKDALTYK